MCPSLLYLAMSLDILCTYIVLHQLAGIAICQTCCILLTLATYYDIFLAYLIRFVVTTIVKILTITRLVNVFTKCTSAAITGSADTITGSGYATITGSAYATITGSAYTTIIGGAFAVNSL